MASGKSEDPLEFDDPKGLLKTVLDQVKSLQTSFSVPLLSVVPLFNGDSENFRQYVKDVERYSHLARLNDSDIPRIVHMTCTGLVADFVSRYFDDCQSENKIISWKVLKDLMAKQFGQVIDSQHVMSILRTVRQGQDETVQMYFEKFIQIAKDAYPSVEGHEEVQTLIQKQLLDMFCDGLCHDFIRLKVLKGDPVSLQEAFEIALSEQNLHKRLNIRSNCSYTSLPVPVTINENNAPYCKHSDPQTRETDYSRSEKCMQCSCPIQINESSVNTENVELDSKVRTEVSLDLNQVQASDRHVRITSDTGQKSGNHVRPDWVRNAECWNCHSIGHLRRHCRKRSTNGRKRKPVYHRVKRARYQEN